MLHDLHGKLDELLLLVPLIGLALEEKREKKKKKEERTTFGSPSIGAQYFRNQARLGRR
jgi:hypothetical protein